MRRRCTIPVLMMFCSLCTLLTLVILPIIVVCTANPAAESPNVFARVSDGFDWIKRTVCTEIPNDRVFCGKSKASKMQH